MSRPSRWACSSDEQVPPDDQALPMTEPSRRVGSADERALPMSEPSQ